MEALRPHFKTRLASPPTLRQDLGELHGRTVTSRGDVRLSVALSLARRAFGGPSTTTSPLMEVTLVVTPLRNSLMGL